MNEQTVEWVLQIIQLVVRLRKAKDADEGLELSNQDVRLLIDMLQLLRSGPK